MEKTKEQILEEMREAMPFHLPESTRPYIEEAMQIYADQESKKYAGWIGNQVIAGRTYAKLWEDYKPNSLTPSHNGR